MKRLPISILKKLWLLAALRALPDQAALLRFSRIAFWGFFGIIMSAVTVGGSILSIIWIVCMDLKGTYTVSYVPAIIALIFSFALAGGCFYFVDRSIKRLLEKNHKVFSIGILGLPHQLNNLVNSAIDGFLQGFFSSRTSR